MSTKSMSPDERLERAENPDAKSEPTVAPLQDIGTTVQPRQAGGKLSASQPTLDAENTADLLARLQDILSLWPGSDNRIVGNFVMTVFPIPAGMKIDKVLTADGKKAYTVNDVPVVSVEQS